MRLEREFTVGAPLDRAWSAMSDAGVLVSCIPGAQLRPIDDVYTGRVEVDLNGGRILCEATVRAVDRDEDEHVATVALHARQLGGPGIGSATVSSRCEPADGATRVLLSADVLSSGHEHSLEALEGAAGRLLDEAAELLRQQAAKSVARPPAPSSSPEPAPTAVVAAGASTASAAAHPGWQRGAALAGGALLAAVLVRRFLGRRRAGLR
jgi:uncharacterized protein